MLFPTGVPPPPIFARGCHAAAPLSWPPSPWAAAWSPMTGAHSATQKSPSAGSRALFYPLPFDVPSEYVPDPATAPRVTAMSAVVFAFEARTRRPVVLKGSFDRAAGERELALLQRLALLNVPHVARPLAHFPVEHIRRPSNAAVLPVNSAGGVVIVLERYQRMPLRMDLETVQRRTVQLAAALAALHSHGIAHLDVTPANLVLDSVRDELVLIDLGLARDNSTSSELDLACGTAGYVAPELLTRSRSSLDCAEEQGPLTKADLFSAGCVIGQWLQPYIPGAPLQCLGARHARLSTAEDAEEALRELYRERGRRVLPEIVYDAANLVAALLVADPQRRLDAAGLFAHPFCNGLVPPGLTLEAAARRQRGAPAVVQTASLSSPVRVDSPRSANSSPIDERCGRLVAHRRRTAYREPVIIYR